MLDFGQELGVAVNFCPRLPSAMKIALAQINPTIGALRANAEKIAAVAAQAVADGAELVIFPEMAIGGYPPRDLVEKPDFIAACRGWLEWASRQCPRAAILCGCATPAAAETGKSVHNSALALLDGELLFQQSKMLLPTYDVFDESRNFAPAARQRIWRWRGLRLAVTICEDAWNDKHYWPQRQRRLYAEDPVADQLRQGADLLINISASPYSHGKMGLREEMLGAIAREYQIPVLFVNQVGGDDQLVFDGSSLVLGPMGELRARLHAFAEDWMVLDSADWRGTVRSRPVQEPAQETEAAYQALVLGTRDYVRKCGFARVMVGLSGGVDSALTAAIAAAALGPEAVTGVAMPGPYSSPGSRADAAQLAANLGIAFHTVDIGPGFAALQGMLRPWFAAQPPNAGAASLAEQNLQSRLRGMVLMAACNRLGALLLATGNKSELAMGYCTLYGDMAGGLNVIGDVLKTEVYALARYINREREVIPRATLDKPPSAELKPDQTDEQDLPPYAILDQVIRDYIEEYDTPERIAARRNLDLALVRDLIRRMDHAEHKRQQAAPGLKISKKAFGMGRRFPIAQQYVPQPAPAAELAAAGGPGRAGAPAAGKGGQE
ncbi:MAG: NAD+ synthase [Terriglobales bacterium]